MYFYPDDVVNILENWDDRSETTVGLTWEDGADPGGVPVEDYRITITSSDSLYNLVVTNNLEQAYTATGLTMGTIYYFSIESRNNHGYSNATDAFPILCAVKPLIPTDLVTTNANENVLV